MVIVNNQILGFLPSKFIILTDFQFSHTVKTYSFCKLIYKLISYVIHYKLIGYSLQNLLNSQKRYNTLN